MKCSACGDNITSGSAVMNRVSEVRVEDGVICESPQNEIRYYIYCDQCALSIDLHIGNELVSLRDGETLESIRDVITWPESQTCLGCIHATPVLAETAAYLCNILAFPDDSKCKSSRKGVSSLEQWQAKFGGADNVPDQSK